jgi:integrase
VPFIHFHQTAEGFRHPATLGAPEVEQFLTHLAVQRHVSASTQNQALGALLFLYRDVLHLDLGSLDARSRRLPVVLSRDEVRPLLAALDALPTSEPYGLMARLMYGAGLRPMECCRLRVKDVDLQRNQLTVRQGKGAKDRVVMLPQAARPGLEAQLGWRTALHQRDRARGLGWVCLPDALDVK